MEGSSKSLYHCRIGAIIWPDCVDKYLFPNDNTEDVAKLKESEDDVREFSQYKMDYHIFLHYWATNKSVKMEEAIEQVEIEMWRVCCEKGVVDATKGGERRGAICAQ
ncbi:hypothetical protein BJY04DRAFT_185649 [Aspergillus karnatakaensis]|uniref:uncharacterized protein n=1 Tax=Aspergillus karnatakaensis TaxID=1810916 RepID=UPI003CCD5035